MNSTIRNLVLWLVVLCLILLVWAVFKQSTKTEKTLQFSELVNDVKQLLPAS